jgi:hypothetical protein
LLFCYAAISCSAAHLCRAAQKDIQLDQKSTPSDWMMIE